MKRCFRYFIIDSSVGNTTGRFALLVTDCGSFSAINGNIGEGFMSQYVILVNESEFGKAYSKMMSAVECLGTLSGELKEANANLSDKWEGRSGNSFAAVAQKMEADFAMLEKGLGRLADELQASYYKFIEMDNILGRGIFGAIGGEASR